MNKLVNSLFCFTPALFYYSIISCWNLSSRAMGVSTLGTLPSGDLTLLREKSCHELPRRYGSALSLEKATLPYLRIGVFYKSEVIHSSLNPSSSFVHDTSKYL